MNERRLDSLTSLRFFAAFVVMALHLSAYLPLSAVVESATRLGYVGVAFFFTLSGFVLAWSSQPGDTLQAFYVRRFARVWPAHAFMTVAAVPVLLIAGTPPTWAALPAVLCLVQAWIPNGSWLGAFNTQSWSLSCEAFFYMAFPLLLTAAAWPGKWLRIATSAIASAVVVVAMAVAVLVPERLWGYLLYVNPLYRLGEFALGMAAAIAIRRGWEPRLRVWHSVVAVATVYGLVLTIAPRDSAGSVPLVVADLALLPAFLGLIVACAASDLAGRTRVLRSRPLVVLGQWSFALYLVHVIVIRSVWLMFRNAGWSTNTWTGVSVIVVAVSVGCAATLYSTIERPFERVLRTRFSGQPTAGVAATAVAALTRRSR